MAQPIEQQLSDEDYHLLTTNSLSHPFAIYKMKPICIYILRVCGWFLLVLGTGELVLLIISGLGLRGVQEVSYLSPVLFIGLSLVSLLAGIFVLFFELPRVRKRRIIVCEQGLLQMKEKSRGRHVEVIYWRDILAIKRLYDRYYIMLRGSEPFTLDILYQHVKNLVALIETRKERATMQVGPGEMYPPLRERESE
jgi:hypothetical protein